MILLTLPWQLIQHVTVSVVLKVTPNVSRRCLRLIILLIESSFSTHLDLYKPLGAAPDFVELIVVHPRNGTREGGILL